MSLRVFHNSVLSFNADTVVIVGPDYLFTDSTTPPVNDQNAISRASVRYMTHTPSIAPNVDVSQFKNIFGRMNASDPIQDFGYVSGSTTAIVVPVNKHFRCQVTVPTNAGTVIHMLKGVSYGSTPGQLAYVRVYPTGNSTPIFAVTNLGFNDTPWVYFTVGLPPNPYHCVFNAGGTYDITWGYMNESTVGGTMVNQWS